MYIILVKNKVSISGKQNYIKVSKEFANDMKEVDGCLDSLVLISNDEENIVLILEIWESKEKYNDYDGSIFLKYKSRLKPYFEGNSTETYTM